jgi:hypothetical protein
MWAAARDLLVNNVLSLWYRRLLTTRCATDRVAI